MTTLNDWNNKKILIADDAIENFTIYKFYLSKTNVQLEFAADGLEAFEKSKLQEFDLYLLDIEMPEMNGHQVLAELKKEKPERVVMAMTAHNLEDHEGPEFNFDEKLVKPISKDLLLEVLGKYLNK